MAIGIGSRVRVLPPFAITLDDEYVVEAWNDEAQAWTLEGVGDFAPEFLEEI